MTTLSTSRDSGDFLANSKSKQNKASELAEQKAREIREAKGITNAQVGMMVLIGSFAMLFGTLLLSYMLIRERQGVWPPIGVEPLDAKITTISTIAVLASSIFIHFAIKAYRVADWSLFSKYWGLGTWLGMGFLALQTGFVAQMWHIGMRVSDGLFASISYTLVIIHGLHVLGAWGWMFWVHLQAMGRKYNDPRKQNPILASWFWHFLGGVWALTYFMMIWF